MKPETEQLKELMRLTGWNQAQTAIELGIAQGNVSRLLREKNAMHGSTRKLIEILLTRHNNVLQPTEKTGEKIGRLS